jgi:hypothetical protein
MRLATKVRPDDAQIVEFPYIELCEIDLFGIFTPSGQSQGPKLREAIRSLRLARVVPSLANSNGNIVKAQSRKQPILTAYQQHIHVVESASADFDIRALAQQVGVLPKI